MQARSNSGTTTSAATTEAATEEPRLPQHTRFPPRGGAATATAAPAASTAAPQLDVEQLQQRKIPVRRPSLELVDSQSFNRDDGNKVSGSAAEKSVLIYRFDGEHIP